jgi:hypothetical protein
MAEVTTDVVDLVVGQVVGNCVELDGVAELLLPTGLA